MKKHPLKLIGTIFAVIACAELAVLLIFLFALRDRTALMIVCGILGFQSIVFGGIGFGFLYHVRKREQRREELIAGGYYEMASVMDTERVMTVRINGRNPFRVICRIERDGVLHEYRSEMCLENPGLLPGDPIPVYLDRQNDNRFYVDVESAIPPVIRHG